MKSFLRNTIPIAMLLFPLVGSAAGQSKLGADASLANAFARAVRKFENVSTHGQKIGYRSAQPDQGYSTNVSTDGNLAISSGSDQLGIKILDFGRTGARNRVVRPTSIAVSKTEDWPTLAMNRGGISEWYVNGSQGLHHWLSISARPGDIGNQTKLSVRLSLSGATKISTLSDSAVQIQSGHHVFAYGGLKAWDVLGRQLPTRFDVSNKTVSLVVDDQNAVYPVTIDPLWTQQQAIAPPSYQSGDTFGSAVAISGNTAIIGGYGHFSTGQFHDAAFIFNRTGNVWNFTQKLVPSPSSGIDNFGVTVALANTPSGLTALVGAPFTSNRRGAAYIFGLSSGNWVQQAKLTASDSAENKFFGERVAISGGSAIVSNGVIFNGDIFGGNPITVPGAVYVYIGSGANWSEQQKLTSWATGNDFFGQSIDIRGDTIAVGAPYSTSQGGIIDAGRVDIFSRSLGVWSIQEALWSSHANDPNSSEGLGWSLAMTDDTLLVGALGANNQVGTPMGAAYVFNSLGGWWIQQQQLIPPTTPIHIDNFGWSVGLFGNVAVVGAPVEAVPFYVGKAYVFTRTNQSWALTQKLAASDAHDWEEFGLGVAVSGDTILVGTASPTPYGAYAFTTPASIHIDFGSAIVGGVPRIGHLQLSSSAPAGGLKIALTSSDHGIPIPPTVSVPEGQTTVIFPILPSAVATDTKSSITASCQGFANGTGDLQVLAPTVQSVQFDKTEIVRGGMAKVTVTLNGPAPESGMPVLLSQSLKGVLTMPNSITVPGGQTQQPGIIAVLIALLLPAVQKVDIVTATTRTTQVSAPIIVRNLAELTSLGLASNSIGVGTTTTGTVTLAGPAGPAGEIVYLTSDQSSATVPSYVAVQPGMISAKFPIASTGKSLVTTKISARVGLTTLSTNLNFIPNSIQSLTLSKSDISEVGSSVLTVKMRFPISKAQSPFTLKFVSSNPSVLPDTFITNWTQSGWGTVVITPIVTKILSATECVYHEYDFTQTSISIRIHPAIKSFTLGSSTVQGGTDVLCTVNLFEPCAKDQTFTATTDSTFTSFDASTNPIVIKAGTVVQHFVLHTVRPSVQTPVTVTLSGATTHDMHSTFTLVK